MSEAIYFSRFFPSTDRGGGSRRMMQIYENLQNILPGIHLITSARGDMITPEMNQAINKRIKRHDSLIYRYLSGGMRKWGIEHRRLVHRLRDISKIWAGSLNKLKDPDIVIMDDPIYYLPLFKKLRERRIPVISVCHNIETLVENQTSGQWMMELFRQELEILSQSILVITISREEDVLLTNMGIRTSYVPYYPVGPIYKRLLAVRENRKHTSKENFLTMGTAFNLPTRCGMANVADYWYENHLEKTAGKLIVAGFGSDVHFPAASYGDAIDFRGALANQAMDALLSHIRAMLCYQEKGAGALTRICEMLIAAVPVLASTHAARSYHNMDGVIEFRTLDDMKDMIHKETIVREEIPLPPKPDMSCLAREIQAALT